MGRAERSFDYAALRFDDTGITAQRNCLRWLGREFHGERFMVCLLSIDCWGPGKPGPYCQENVMASWKLLVASALLLATSCFSCSQGSAEGSIDDLTGSAETLSPADGVPETRILPSDLRVEDLFQDVLAMGDALAELVPQCAPGEGCFLDPCDENGDCQSGWCVEHLGEGVCAMGCQEECPPGWSCKQVGQSDPDVVWVCVSEFANLCKPCATGADCTSAGGADDACIAYPGEGAFCGGACAAGKACPGGFACEQVETVDGVELEQCVATEGTCDCTQNSIALGLWTQCEVTGDVGTCYGKRICTADGLTDCDAVAPVAETCNGIDDDCDGSTDEPSEEGGSYIHLCDDDNDCTEDVCNGAQGCGHISLTGTPCNAPDPCADAKVCQDGVCTGELKSCDDGKICTVDTCDPVDGHCSHEAKDGNCPNSNNPCVSMVFCDPFADVESDPNQDGCIVLYKPEGTGCNDGDACTSGETCNVLGNNLVCQGVPIGFDDDDPCTNDSCDPLTGPKHDAIPGCLAPCEPGEILTGACGQCGLHSKVCPQSGKWSDAEWGACGGEGECLPGGQESILCGNCGFHTRVCNAECQWGSFGECVNEGACTPGDNQYEGCEGECTSKARVCGEACQWGEWGNCEVTGNCTPGESENQSCGTCGTQARSCTDFCVWSDWGECGNEGACAAGAVETQACGLCGTQSRTCTGSCQWAAWSECGGVGVCSPGQQLDQNCGNCGTQSATCNDSCQWGAWTNCAGSGECSAGAMDEVSCGDCKVQKRTCSNSCEWGAWGQCTGGGVCSPGQQESQDCGNCGSQSRSCTNSCQWGNWSSCSGQGSCSPNQTGTQSCGNCGSQERTCNWNCSWGSWSGCDDPCKCECNGGTCCSNGCDYDNSGTSCGGTCKQCNGSGSCVNKSNGTWCAAGECYNGQCVECLTGQVEDCDPNCGVFSDPDDGERTCSNNTWGVCKPVWCGGVNYPIAPMDSNWHCGYVANFNIYLCAQVQLSWMCADFLEIRLMKSWNVYGTDETGPWDNDLKVVLRNKSNGKTYTQSTVSCAGNTDSNGGCSFNVGNSTFTGSLNVGGTDTFEVEIYSPKTSPTPVGKTGTFSIKECY